MSVRPAVRLHRGDNGTRRENNGHPPQPKACGTDAPQKVCGGDPNDGPPVAPVFRHRVGKQSTQQTEEREKERQRHAKGWDKNRGGGRRQNAQGEPRQEVSARHHSII